MRKRWEFESCTTKSSEAPLSVSVQEAASRSLWVMSWEDGVQDPRRSEEIQGRQGHIDFVAFRRGPQ